ncbi:uncharacterized protein LOC116293216 [Actinia tenebrosa]|uniref:Uncharacterized protein LOC116293216 n=1 Tax=Actinia tenebrosa TaxID=6105 RepID=A0A6P8HV52_ACTTE|nr:uncharacterized protein LOC116293216 [Actinia tenebrosa]XP_031556478.1 uncharacterized protein LOC116293216 [Actinia tenebrosa]
MTSFLPFLKRHTVVVSLLSLALLPSMYFLYLYLRKTHHPREPEDQQDLRERRRQKVTELRSKLDRLLVSLDQIVPETADNEDDECIVCNSAKAVIQTFPCKHKVLCRGCFVRTLQVAVNDFNLPLKCVLCRTRITTLDRERFEELTLQESSTAV